MKLSLNYANIIGIMLELMFCSTWLYSRAGTGNLQPVSRLCGTPALLTLLFSMAQCDQSKLSSSHPSNRKKNAKASWVLELRFPKSCVFWISRDARLRQSNLAKLRDLARLYFSLRNVNFVSQNDCMSMEKWLDEKICSSISWKFGYLRWIFNVVIDGQKYRMTMKYEGKLLNVTKI